jgi:hypothetical protein
MPEFISTAISRAEYDGATGTLSLWFVESGGPYSYYGVPEHIFAGLCAAFSKGRYFNENIRDRFRQ